MKKFTFLMIALLVAAMGFAQKEASSVKRGPIVLKKAAKQINYSTRNTRAAIFSEDFEGTGLPTGWTTIDADEDGYCWETLATTSADFAEGYGNNSNGAMVSWSYYPTTHSSQGWSGESLNTNDYLITPQITVPAGDSKLVFYVASFNGSDYPDDIEVKISTTGTAQADFTTLMANETVTASVPNFAERNISLNAYAGQQVYIAFVHQSEDCFSIVLDDVSVMEITPYDIAVTSVELSENSGCGLTTTNAVVTLTNNGTSAISAFTLAYTINNGTPVSENVTADIAPEATYEYTFENINISEEGEYSIEVTATLEGDGNTADNSKTATIAHLAPAGIPYYNAFDTDDDLTGLSLINANADGVSWSLYYMDEDNQDDLWPGIQTYNASAGNDDYFVTSCINITAGTYILSVDVNAGYGSYYTEDFSIVYGTAPTADALTNVIYETTGYAAEETLVREFTVNADGTYYIAFRVTSAAGAQFLINNLSIITPPTTPEIELTSISIANGATYVAGNNITLSGVVKNNGIALTSYKVAYTVDGGTPVEYSVSGINVELGGTHNFTHETPIVLEAGNHAIAVTVSNPNGEEDGDDSDNTITVNVNVIDCDAISELPYTQDFENGLTACWGTISNNTANDVASGRMGIYEMEGGNKVFRFSSYSSADNDDYNQYLITPEIALTADATLSFDYAARYADEPESFRVMVSTTDNSIASFSAIGETVNTESDQFMPFTITIPANTKYIAINYFSDFLYYLYIDNFALNTVTSVEENIAEAISVYPNPTSDMVTIANAEGKDIVVINSLGQVVASIENAAANQTINVTNFANGTYFVKVDGEVVKLNVVK
jgi:hypothetical protein